MKIWLSDYWKKNFMVTFVIIVLLIFSTIVFCFWSHDEEDYIPILLALFFLLVYSSLLTASIKLLRYAIKTDNTIIMQLLIGKEICAVNTDNEVYYEILPLVEGVYSTQNFIILSNKPFSSYRKMNYKGLRQACKEIDKNGKQIILPYKKSIFSMLNLTQWHKVDAITG